MIIILDNKKKYEELIENTRLLSLIDNSFYFKDKILDIVICDSALFCDYDYLINTVDKLNYIYLINKYLQFYKIQMCYIFCTDSSKIDKIKKEITF